MPKISKNLLLSSAESFWKRVDIRGPDECWPWLGHTNGSGYGYIEEEHKTKNASRYAWELTHHNRRAGRFKIRHTCDNPPCCNPRHLRRGTHWQNMQDAKKRGQMARGEENGQSKLTRSKVEVIKALHKKGHTNTRIAKMMKVSQPIISRILSGQLWRHVK